MSNSKLAVLQDCLDRSYKALAKRRQLHLKEIASLTKDIETNKRRIEECKQGDKQ